MKRYLLAAALLGITCTAHGAGLSYVGGVYSQDFDSLISTGTAPWVDGVALPGWYAVVGTSAATGYEASPPIGMGYIASLGTIGSTERALGFRVGNDPADWVAVGLRLTNDTGAPLDTVTVSFTGEQWRSSRFAATTLLFSHSTSATGLSDNAAFTSLPALDFTAPTPLVIAGAPIDGNDPANRTALSATFTVNWQPGQSLWLRWDRAFVADTVVPLGVDDLTLEAASTGSTVPLPSSALAGLAMIAAGLLSSGLRRRRMA